MPLVLLSELTDEQDTFQMCTLPTRQSTKVDYPFVAAVWIW